jgi:hypothetical protein
LESSGIRCVHTRAEHRNHASFFPKLFAGVPQSTDCQVSTWYDTSVCSATCGYGTKSQQRIVLSPPSASGLPCPFLFRNVACEISECPVCPTGLEYTLCGRIEHPTCDNPYPPSTSYCGAPTCQCPSGLLMTASYKCVVPEMCPKGIF